MTVPIDNLRPGISAAVLMDKSLASSFRKYSSALSSVVISANSASVICMSSFSSSPSTFSRSRDCASKTANGNSLQLRRAVSTSR